MTNRILNLLMVFVFAAAIPAYAVEQHELTFEWSYPDSQNDIINGFRIYKNIDNGTKKQLIVEINNAMMRMAKKKVTLSSDITEFYVVPFIGDREGDPTTTDIVKLAPFFPVSTFIVKCPTCGPQE